MNSDCGFADNRVQDMRESACLSRQNINSGGGSVVALLSAWNGVVQSWCSLSFGELGYLMPGSVATAG